MPLERKFRAALPLSLLLCLSGCLDVPHPFRDPGRIGRDLAGNPPPSRLDIPLPKDTRLDEGGTRLWVNSLVEALLAQSVPAIAQPVRPGDWWLKMRVEQRGDMVVPLYSLMTPKGEIRATQEGQPVPSSAWNVTNPGTLQDAAGYGAAQVVTILNGVQAERMEEDPKSLKHRGARIWFRGVTGAPGDGNVSLSRAFVTSFREMKDTVQTSREDADFAVAATVKLSDGPAGLRNHPQQNIEIQWRVTDRKESEVGIATQIHGIPAHSLDGMWGDVALAAAGEAAGAVEEMITRYSNRDAKPLPQTQTRTQTQPAAAPK